MKINFQPTNEFEIEKACRDAFDMNFFHYHKGYEIFYIESGSRTVIIKDQIVTLNKNDIGLIPPDIIHRTVGGAYTRYVINFTDEFLVQYFSKKQTDRFIEIFSRNKISLTHEESAVIKQCCNKMLKDGKADETRTCLHLGELLMTLEGHKNLPAEASPLSAPEALVSAVLDYLNTNFSTLRKIDELEQQFFVSKYYLCRVFKRFTGISIINYLNNIKLKNACDLLVNTDEKVIRIAEKCGYQSSMYFCKVFKDNLGMTPSEYRFKQQ